LPLGPNLN